MKNKSILFVITIVRGEVYMLVLQKYSLKLSVILFGFYSKNYKVYIHLPCINTQWWITAPFDITQFISYSNRQMPILYQWSEHRCEVVCNFYIIGLLKPSQTIHYCNWSVLELVPDMNILVWSILIFDLISRGALVQYFSIKC